MATATTTFGSLSVPAPDDTMEMSSPANRNLDDDIDIDFEDFSGGVHVIDDDRMLEDGDPTRPTTATDDMMEDDTLPGEQAQTEEEVMQDDGPQMQQLQQEEDEELIDYGEDDFQEQLVDETLLPSVIEEPSEIAEFRSELIDEGLAQVAENPTVDAPVPALSLIEDITSDAAQILNPPSSAGDIFTTDADVQEAVILGLDDAVAGEPQAEEGSETAVPALQPHVPTDPNQTQLGISINTAISSTTDSPDTPTDTGLHPMTIRYGDLFMPLFKSKRQPDGLLKDDNLANLSLGELIKNCRQQLKVKLGEDISDDQEVVLGFEHMGLMLAEDRRAAFESSLNDVLEVYLQLHQNDGAVEIPPLSLNLSLQLKFQSSFSILKQAAAGGQGMSSFGFLQHTATDHEDYYQEEFGDDVPGTDGEAGHQEHYDEEQNHEEPDREAQAQEEDYQQEQFHEGQYQDDEHYEEEDYEETTDDAFHALDQDEAGARLDELEADDGHATDANYNAPVNPGNAEEPAAHVDDDLGLEHLAESTAKSTTVQGEAANGNTKQTENGHDLETFLTEPDDEDSKAAFLTDGQELGDESTNQAIDGQHLGSEDLLDELTGQEYADEAYDGQQYYDEDHEAGEEVEYQDYAQADTYDEQQEEYHPDYQPGEDDEQFHTAQDLLKLEHYEHGPEHDVHGEDEDNIDDTLETVFHHDTGDYVEDLEQEEFGDDLRFGDEATSNQQYDSTSQARVTKITSDSPLGKRSFDEVDELEDDETERELKKARSS